MEPIATFVAGLHGCTTASVPTSDADVRSVAGMDDYFSKPVNRAKLEVSTLREAIAQEDPSR